MQPRAQSGTNASGSCRRAPEFHFIPSGPPSRSARPYQGSKPYPSASHQGGHRLRFFAGHQSPTSSYERDSEILADLSGEEIVDLVVARDGRSLVLRGIVPPRVAAALPQQLAAMFLLSLVQMGDNPFAPQISPRPPGEGRG